ncbi:MAG: hypothetical protein JST43_07455 [Bacteroidetes bacterium]|nr:hypothetical protein [Bacteroidota bacterium]MBS1540884.1 hypothetical protein [Bacteroidota bacterium]
MQVIRSFKLIINYKTLLVTIMAVLSTYLCYSLGWTAKFPDMLVGVAIVFPVVFSIGSAYTRRETALQRFSDFKGHAIAVYYASRDWASNKENDLPAQARQLVREMLHTLRMVLRAQSKQEWDEQEKKMYDQFSKLSMLTMQFRNFGVQSGEISRVSQYISKMIIAFDNMRIIHRYRTPITLRAYSKVFIYTFPIIYGPYFASTFRDFSAQLEYVMPILYSFILVSLDNIQDHLENPFDEVGEDDIVIDVEETAQFLS